MIRLSKYDTDVTIRYKCIPNLRAPVRYISVIPVGKSPELETDIVVRDNIYRSIVDYTEYLMSQNKRFDEVFNEISETNSDLTVDNLLMIYLVIMSNIPDFQPEDNLFEIFNICHKLVTGDEFPKFSDNYDLQNFYMTWESDLSRELTSDLEKLSEIEESENTLLEIESDKKKISFSDTTISSVDYIYQPTLDNNLITELDGMELFNRVTTSWFLPICVYIDSNGKVFTNIFNNGKDLVNPNTLFEPAIYNNRNFLFFKYNTAKDAKTTYKDSFNQAYLSLSTGIFYIHVPLKNKIDYPKLLEKQIQGLSLGPGEEIQVGGSFEVFINPIPEFIFADCITNNSIVSNYLFLDENQKLLGRKKRFDFHFKSMNDEEGNPMFSKKSVSLNYKQEVSKERRIINVSDGMIVVHEGQESMLFTVSQAESRKTLEHFMEIFKLLLKVMIRETPKIEQLYFSVSEQLKYHKDLVNEPEPVEEGLCRMDLQELAGDLFVTNYSKRCPCDSQPKIILTEEEYSEWKDQGNQILPFPNDNPRWFFVCPYKDKKYPGVKANYDLPNRDKFPYIVCCWDTPHMGLDNVRYQNYLNNVIPVRKIGAKADKKISTKKILSPDRVAFVPRDVEKVLKTYSKDSHDISRYGVPVSPSSLIHCVLVAIEDPVYMSLKDKEVYVNTIRKYISESVHPSLMKQEMYDFSDFQIMDQLSNENKYLDPDLYYRALEELFNINLYVFTSIGDDKDFLGAISPPRYKHFFCRPLRNRPSVLVIKNVDSKLITYEHCELIVDYNEEKNEVIKLFGLNMTKLCHELVNDSVGTLTFHDNSILKNIYTMDLLDLIKYPPRSQILDKYGKLRGITFKGPAGYFTITSEIPCQPENLPVAREIHHSDPITMVSIFGHAPAYSVNKGKLVDTLWYPAMGFPECIAVYVEPIYPTYDSELVDKLSYQIIDSEYTDLRRDALILLELIRWFYTFKPDQMTNEEFLVEYFEPVDREIKYNFTDIPWKLPNVNTLDEALKIKIPGLIHNNKILVSHDFYDNLLPYLNKIGKRELKRKSVIQNKYRSLEDFTKKKNNYLFDSERELINWLRSLKVNLDYSKYFTTLRSLHSSFSSQTEPYIYKDPYSRIWLIQNIKSPNLDKATYLSKYYIDNNINLGYNSQAVDEITPVNIYGIDSSGNAKLLKTEPDGVPVLYYGTDHNSYAVMLQLV